MHLLKSLSASAFLLLAAAAPAQQSDAKPAEAAKKPAEAIAGVWHGTTPTGKEFITFMADGRAVMQNSTGETMQMTYQVDAAAEPWKLNLTVSTGDKKVPVYTVFALPSPDEFVMALPAPDEAKRPDAAALKDAKVKMKRITLAAHGGIHQVVEAMLKKLAGAWQGMDNDEPIGITFSTDGTYTMHVGTFTDKGRFRIDASKPPIAIDLLSTEGAGVKYSIFEFTAEGQLRVGTAAVDQAERPAIFSEVGSRTYTKTTADTPPLTPAPAPAPVPAPPQPPPSTPPSLQK